jgi:hypothetical protein
MNLIHRLRRFTQIRRSGKFCYCLICVSLRNLWFTVLEFEPRALPPGLRVLRMQNVPGEVMAVVVAIPVGAVALVAARAAVAAAKLTN